MKKITKSVIFLFLLVSGIFFVSADNNLYLYNELTLQLDVTNSIELVKDGGGATVKELETELLLYPQVDYRQQIMALEMFGPGEESETKTSYEWDDPELGSYNFGYSATIKTENEQKKVKTEIKFPLTNLDDEFEKYLGPTETIDSDNADIIAKANELVEGEDDLFKVVFNLAYWVEQNINYELTTLTAESSQKASWVLENKNGVCDEMTSLFIAMARSVGIPARFVSGISYTTSDLFDEKWQSHGWAEVYFPEVGWVSFDITFGEYGYVDVTHIKLREGADPSEPAVTYKILANNVELSPSALELNTQVSNKGFIVPEKLLIEMELLSDEVGFGSYNLVKGILKNTVDYYQATTLQMAVPPEIELVNENKRTILLHPDEVRETYWVIKVPENLDENYWYQYPIIIYSEKNVSVQDQMKSYVGKSVYSKAEIEKLTVQDEEKSYSRKISFNCDYPEKIFLNQETNVTTKCTVKNSGNSILSNLNFCLNDECELVELPINQEESRIINLEINKSKVGWNKLLLSAENEHVEKRTSYEYAVYDNPNLVIETTAPRLVNYVDKFQIKISINKDSFQTPENVVVDLSGPGFVNNWDINKIDNEETLALELNNLPLSKENEFLIKIVWEDQNGEKYSYQETVIVNAQADSFKNKFKMFVNGILKLFA